MRRTIYFSFSLPSKFWRWGCSHAPYVVQESRRRLSCQPPDIISFHWSLRCAVKALKKAGKHYSMAFDGNLSYDLVRRSDGLRFVLRKGGGGYFSNYIRINHHNLVSDGCV